jgi:hypothetical protein
VLNFRLSAPHHSLNVSLKEYSVLVIKNSYLYTNFFRTHIYSISPTISYPLSLSLSSSSFTGAHERSVPVAYYCSKHYCRGSDSVARCSSFIALFSVQSGLPIYAADSLNRLRLTDLEHETAVEASAVTRLNSNASSTLCIRVWTLYTFMTQANGGGG